MYSSPMGCKAAAFLPISDCAQLGFSRVVVVVVYLFSCGQCTNYIHEEFQSKVEQEWGPLTLQYIRTCMYFLNF